MVIVTIQHLEAAEVLKARALQDAPLSIAQKKVCSLLLSGKVATGDCRRPRGRPEYAWSITCARSTASSTVHVCRRAACAVPLRERVPSAVYSLNAAATHSLRSRLPAACARSQRSAASNRVWIALGRQLGLGLLRAPDAQLRVGDRRCPACRSARPGRHAGDVRERVRAAAAVSAGSACPACRLISSSSVCGSERVADRSRSASANRPPERAQWRACCRAALEPGLHRGELRIALRVGRRRKLGSRDARPGR